MRRSLVSAKRYNLVIAITVVCLITAMNAQAQLASQISSASSPNPVGSGARATGMGGAFIAVTDDATAASWNPGGLIQLETPEVSIVGAYNHRTEDTTYEDFPEASGPQDYSTFDLNYFSVAYPFSLWNRNMIVSLNYQHLYDFGKEISYQASDETSSASLDYSRKGGLRSISPAYAIQVTPKVSLGATLNIWQDPLYDNEWQSTWTESGKGTVDGGRDYSYQTTIEDTYQFSGVNINLGFLWHINHIITLGGVFKSPFTADLQRDYHQTNTTSSEQGDPLVDESSDSMDETLDMPMSYGIGIATRWSDAFTLSFDLYRTKWGDYVLHTEDGEEISPITNAPIDESNIDATTQVRLGGEYLFMADRAIIPLRAGVFYDPEPAPDHPDDFWGLSIGSGIAYKQVAFDLAYQFRFAEDVRAATVGSGEASQDVQQHTLYMSVIYHF